MAMYEGGWNTSWDDFHDLSEVYCGDEDDSLIFDSSAFIAIGPDYSILLGGLPIRKLQAGLEQAKACQRRVHDHEIYPSVPE